MLANYPDPRPDAEQPRQARTLTTLEGLKSQFFARIHRIPAELPHSGELEPKNSIRIEGILTDLPCSSYNEDYR
jgi:hypothetical protein